MTDFDVIRNELCAEIERAFGNVQRGNGVTLHQAEVIDSYGSNEEEQKARLLDTDGRWQDVPDADIAQHYSILPFLDAAGYLYYLPAYMSWTLRNYDRPTDGSCSGDFTIYSLGQLAQQWAQYFLFDERQCEVIRRFLEFMVLYAGGLVDDTAASQALPFWESYRVTPEHLRPKLISETVERLPHDQLLITQTFAIPSSNETTEQ